MKQPKLRPLCRQIFCKATSVSAQNLQPRIAQMHSNLTTSVILLLSAQILAPLRAQTTTSATGNTVTLHDITQSQSAAPPVPSLREVAADLSGTVIGQMPNISIQFLLTLKNNGPEEVQILDPLESFSVQISTSTNKLIPLLRRVPKDLPKVAFPKGRSSTEKPRCALSRPSSVSPDYK